MAALMNTEQALMMLSDIEPPCDSDMEVDSGDSGDESSSDEGISGSSSSESENSESSSDDSDDSDSSDAVGGRAGPRSTQRVERLQPAKHFLQKGKRGGIVSSAVTGREAPGI